jgi:ribosomal-protein-alanine N-acetyltransferase
MLITNFTPFPTLKTNRLVLRDIESSDAEHVQYIGRPLMAGREEANTWVEIIKSNQAANESINWMIAQHTDNEAIGNICLWRLEKHNYRAEIGYMLAAGHQGKGLMQEAIAAVIAYGFNDMGLHSIEANVDPRNQASIKLLERNGFVREAYYRENHYFNGEFLIRQFIRCL